MEVSLRRAIACAIVQADHGKGNTLVQPAYN